MGTPALLARGPDAGGSSVQRPEEMMLFQASLVEGARDDHSIGAECAGMMFFAVPAMLHALLFASVYPLARCFSQILVRWLGNISYSYYLIHGGALHVFRLLLDAIWSSAPKSARWFWLLLPISVAVTVVATIPLFLLVEKRFSLKPQPEKTAA